jgi:hypothetical protein
LPLRTLRCATYAAGASHSSRWRRTARRSVSKRDSENPYNSGGRIRPRHSGSDRAPGDRVAPLVLAAQLFELRAEDGVPAAHQFYSTLRARGSVCAAVPQCARPDCSQRTASTVLHGHCSPRRGPPHHVIDRTTPGHCLFAHCRLPSVRSLARSHAHAGVARVAAGDAMERRCKAKLRSGANPLIFTRAVRPSEQRRPGG